MISKKKYIESLSSTESDTIHEEELKVLGTLYAGLSHEINNPLNFAVLGTELLKEKGRSMMADEFDSTISDIENGLQRISCLVKDLRMLAHKDQSNLLLESFLVRDVVASSIRMTAERTRNINIMPILESPYRVKGGASSITQVLVNLINNAVDSINNKWPDYGGYISIYGKTENKKYVIEVVDNGTGLSKNDIATLFTPFKTTKATGHGTGLGMTICKSIIKQHGGSIRVDSLLDHWASISFNLELDSN